MKFRFRQREEKVKLQKTPFFNDIILNNKKKLTDLHKRYLVIRIDPEFFKDFFRVHHHFMSLIGIFLIITIIGSFSGFARADIAKFYPTTCLGSWEHPENVEGEPSLTVDANASDFNLSNSAHMQSSSGALYCGGFKGNIPANTKPTRFRISLNLSVDDGSVKHGDTQPVDNSTNSITAPINDVSPNSTIPATITPTVPDSTPTPSVPPTPASSTPLPDTTQTPPVVPDSTSQSDTQPPTSSPDSATPPSTTTSPADNNTSAPQSFLYNLFSNTAFAQDVTSAPVQTTPNNSDQFLEVDYTLDGTTWNTLGNISRSSWQNNSFDIPLNDWTNLNNLQISVKSVPTFDDPSVVYLDSMTLSIDYDNIQKLIDTPTIKLNNSASVISSDKTDFNSNEQPVFTITNPNLDTSDIKNLVDQKKAEIISDPNNVLGSPDASPTQPATPTTANDSLKQIINPPLNDNSTDTKPVSFNFFQTNTAYAADFFDQNNISASVLNANGDATNILATVETVSVNNVEQQQVKVLLIRSEPILHH